jgi:hypothetical protein
VRGFHAAEKSAIQRIKDLEAERAGIFEQTKAAALEKANAALAELNALGLNYMLTSGAKAAKAGSAKGPCVRVHSSAVIVPSAIISRSTS